MSNKTKAFLESYPPGMIYNVRSRIFSLSKSISKRDSEKLIFRFCLFDFEKIFKKIMKPLSKASLYGAVDDEVHL